MNTKGCESCRKIPAGTSKRTGKPYEAFYTCDNADCPNFKPQNGQYSTRKQSSIGIGEAEAINKRLDSMAQWMAEQFSEIMQKLIDIERK